MYFNYLTKYFYKTHYLTANGDYNSVLAWYHYIDAIFTVMYNHMNNIYGANLSCVSATARGVLASSPPPRTRSAYWG